MAKHVARSEYYMSTRLQLIVGASASLAINAILFGTAYIVR